MSQIKKLDNLIVKILKEELANNLKEEDSRIEDLKREIEDIKSNYDLGLLTDNERRRQLENIKSKYKSLMTVARLKGIDMNEEEMGSSQKGSLNVPISKEFAYLLIDPRVSDNPSYVSFMSSKDGGKNYNLKIQSKTPEFKELKNAMKRVGDYANTAELEKIYHDVMAGIEKADIEGSVDLIKKGRKLGLEEEEKEFITSTGTSAGATPEQKSRISRLPAGTTVTYRKPGEKSKLGLGEQKEPQLDSEPTGTDIAGQVAEIVDKLKLMSEGSKDPKKQKLAARVMKQIEAAKATLEALTAHETMLEEKKQQEEEKDAQKHVSKFKKHLTKLVKEPAAVEKIAAKMTPQKMADLKRKVKSGELDEEKLARVMLNRALQEGWVKKNDSIKEDAFSTEWLHVFNDLLDPDKIAHLAKHADLIKKTITILVGSNMAAKYLSDKLFNLTNKAKKPGAVQPQEVEKIKDEIETAYNKAPEEKKKVFNNNIQAIEKQVEREIAESSLN